MGDDLVCGVVEQTEEETLSGGWVDEAPDLQKPPMDGFVLGLRK